MKYKDILHFEPITDVIQFDKLSERDYQLDILHNFVYPDYFLETVIPEFVKNMVFGSREQKGLQIIGSYGTGKSHLMSLVQLVAENENNLQEIRNDRAREIMAPIAGKFHVQRFELQHSSNIELWDIVKYQIQLFLEKHDIDFHFDPNSLKGYGEQISEMMAAFEEKYPDKGFILAIDEMLHYLKGCAEKGNLASQLPLLQALGQACNGTKFVFMFGAQELIYSAREFQFVANALRQVRDRFRDLIIRRDDVSFVVQRRLLDKSDEQKARIREHLQPFTQYFADMHGHLDKYVDLFPVHPSFIENFEKITIAKAQREILKTISAAFNKIKNQEIPTNEPGLITYDQYFEQMMVTGFDVEPDFKVVSDTVKLIHDRIDNNFEGVMRSQIPLAKRIANACGIKILQGPLNKQTGAKAETLTDDLCCTFPIMDDRDFLIDQVDNCADLIVKATSGQYFDKKDNEEYALRTEGGINPDQIIKARADSLSPAMRDKAFSAFMVEMLAIDNDPFRTGFDIYEHELPWQSHRITRDGYIFFGGPNEKSTTHPRQHFYMIFMPVFRTDVQRGHDSDEVYFVMNNLSDECKNLICLHGAATLEYNAASTQQKPIFLEKRDQIFRKANAAFRDCYAEVTQVYYNGNEPRSLRSFSLPGTGAPLMEIFDGVASAVLEDAFSAASPAYPSFTASRFVITNENRQRFINNALAKIIKPESSNPDGESLLAGLNLYHQGQLSADHCDYALSLIDKMEELGRTLLNRDEIMSPVHNSQNKIWRTLDFNIEADLEFVVLATMVQLGHIEIKLENGTLVNASNIDQLRNVAPATYSQFILIKKPQGINIPLVRQITKAFYGQDLSSKLDQEETYSIIVNRSRELAAEIATFQGRTLNSIENLSLAGRQVFDPQMLHELKVVQLPALKGFFDQMSRFSSHAKLRNLQFSSEVISKFEATKKLVDTLTERYEIIQRLSSLIKYLSNAKQYVPAKGELMDEIERQVEGSLEFNPVESSEAEAQALETSLTETKQKYIDFYLKRYRAVCLSELQQGERNAILNSPEYQVCLTLRDCPVINPGVFSAWKADFVRLRVPEASVMTDIKTMPSPVSGFSPITSNPSPKSIAELRQELTLIYENWCQHIVDFLQEGHIQQQLSLLSQSDRDYAMRIISHMEPIDNDNSARSVIEFVKHVSQDLKEVVITPELLNKNFKHAMTPSEFQNKMDLLILKLCDSTPQDKVRIIFRLNENDNE